PLADQFPHRHLVGVGNAEIAGKQAADPVPVAGPGGIVEAELLTQHLKLAGLGIDAENQQRGIARQNLQDDEDDDRREQQGADQRRESLGQKQAQL
ncbi:hypothetical protein ACO1MR_14075, partial [Staphylococcus aureus]